MIQTEIQGHKFYLPSSIEDVTIERFLAFRMISPSNSHQLIQWLLNTDIQFTDDDKIENQIANCLNISQNAIEDIYTFVNSEEKHLVPEYVDILGLRIEFKNDFINKLPYWPYEVCKALINNENQKEHPDLTNIIPDILSHYFYSLISKEAYNEDRASEFKDIINDIPMVQAIQSANFFFRKCQSSSNGKLKNLIRRLNQNMKKRG